MTELTILVTDMLETIVRKDGDATFVYFNPGDKVERIAGLHADRITVVCPKAFYKGNLKAVLGNIACTKNSEIIVK